MKIEEKFKVFDKNVVSLCFNIFLAKIYILFVLQSVNLFTSRDRKIFALLKYINYIFNYIKINLIKKWHKSSIIDDLVSQILKEANIYNTVENMYK